MDTEFFVRGALATIRLNRPMVLNALGPEQFPAILRQLAAWKDDPAVGAIVVEGAGDRAFCAGGDIRAVWENRQRGNDAGNRALFRTEYTLDRFIHRFPKPYVALLDGIVMGGGAGISVNGAFQVVTERALFAMPEAAIGFFPDVGATHFLNRCPGRIGLYLGLTGARLQAADMLWCGLASHHVPSTGLTELKAALAQAAAASDPWSAVREVLAAAADAPSPGWLPAAAPAIDACFGGATISDVAASVAAHPAPWAQEAMGRMTAASPTSLAVVFRQLVEGRGLSFEQVMAREYRMASAFLAGDDFYEGIRAAVIDKDWKAGWRPGTLAEVDGASVDHYFAGVADELDFAGA